MQILFTLPSREGSYHAQTRPKSGWNDKFLLNFEHYVIPPFVPAYQASCMSPHEASDPGISHMVPCTPSGPGHVLCRWHLSHTMSQARKFQLCSPRPSPPPRQPSSSILSLMAPALARPQHQEQQAGGFCATNQPLTVSNVLLPEHKRSLALHHFKMCK